MPRSVNDTDQDLLEAAKEGPAAYYPAVIRATRFIHERLNSVGRLSATIVGSDASRLKELLSASLVLNDCTAIVFAAKGELKVHLPPAEQFPAMFGCDAIRLRITPEQVMQYKIDMSNPALAPCFIYSESQVQKPLMNALLPFIERGSVVFRPSRGVIAKQGQPGAWQIIGVPDDQRLDIWVPETPQPLTSPVAMEIQGPIENGRTLFEVTLPFIKGVPLRDLAKLLADEEDGVQAFRAAVRSVVGEAVKSGRPSDELVNDVIQPKLLLLDRKLRSLQRIHGLKVGGAAMSSVALAFTATSAGQVGGSLLAIASAGGFGFIANQYADYVEKRDELHQDPYYFLWKVRRGTKR